MFVSYESSEAIRCMLMPGKAFQVQGPDDYGPSGSGRFDGAMSRPPSRVNNKSPLGKIIDLTAEHAAG